MSQHPPVIHSDPEILGGTPVFVGTRVPFRNLIDYLEHGHSLDEFLDEFPSVSREQAVAALEAAHEVLTAGARCCLTHEPLAFRLLPTIPLRRSPADARRLAA